MLEVIAGPMFSGKTDELLRRAGAGALFKPWVDDRHASAEIVSHSGARRPVTVVARSAELGVLARGAPLVGIDEGQFFDLRLAEVAEALSRAGAHVVVATLDRDFRAVPFPVGAGLIERADRVDLLRAVSAGAAPRRRSRSVSSMARRRRSPTPSSGSAARSCTSRAARAATPRSGRTPSGSARRLPAWRSR